jgi:hypothetical protein
VTHLYTILLGGNVIPARDQPAVSAIAWAGDTVIGLGSDEELRGLSRGDSWFVDLEGASVVPLGGDDATWPIDGTLEIGGRADLAVVAGDPRVRPEPSTPPPMVALVRGGRVVAGRLPGSGRAHHDHGSAGG